MHLTGKQFVKVNILLAFREVRSLKKKFALGNK